MRKTTAELKKLITAADSMRVSQLQEDLFIKGYAFSVHELITITPTTNRYFHFDARAFCEKFQYVFNPLILLGVDAGPIQINISVAPTLTAGGRTPLNAFNLRGTSSNTLCATAEEVAAANVSSAGTVFIPKIVPSYSGPGVTVGAAGAGVEGLPFELNPAYDYLISFDNENSSNARLEIEIDFFEIPL